MEYQDIVFFVGRLLYGGFFVIMGMNHFTKLGSMAVYASSKGVPIPKPLVLISGLLIVLGGLGIAAGVYIGLSVLYIAVFLVIVTPKMHNFWAIEDPQTRVVEMVNFLKNTALLGGALMLLSIPTPWSYSLF